MEVKETEVYLTNGVIMLCLKSPEFKEFVSASAKRHINHDWGEVDKEDQERNNRLPDEALSEYTHKGGLKIWVKSENGFIIVLLPKEY